MLVGGEALSGVYLGLYFTGLMSSSVSVPLSVGSLVRVPWTSSVSLHRFVWAFQLGVGVGIGLRSDCSRVALAVWLRRMDISVSRSESGAPASSHDEQMLDWLVSSVRGGSDPPQSILLCFFPIFGDLLFRMITDCAEEV